VRWLPVVAIASACGGGGGGSKPAPTTPTQEAKVDSHTAEKDAKGLVTEIYNSLNHADTDGLLTLLSDRITVFGPRKADALGRSDALVELRKQVDPKAKKKAQVMSAGLEVVPSSGGHSAWVFDVIQLGASEPIVITAVLSNADDLWLVTVATIAKKPPMKLVRAELKKDAVVPNAMTAPAKIDPAAEAAVERFKKGLLEQEVWGEDLGSRSDAVVIGPSKGDITRGKKDIKAMWKKRLKAGVREVATGEISAGATPDGQLAWVSAPVNRAETNDDLLPLRAFAVFEKGDSGWKMIALHESLALDAPGAGAALKKIAPPAPAKPDDDKKKPDDSKKKKKKSKPAPTDD
jgi:ketosteroid isomerase-like protein